jgi:hypothetical protein
MLQKSFLKYIFVIGQYSVLSSYWLQAKSAKNSQVTSVYNFSVMDNFLKMFSTDYCRITREKKTVVKTISV